MFRHLPICENGKTQFSVQVPGEYVNFLRISLREFHDHMGNKLARKTGQLTHIITKKVQHNDGDKK